MKRKILLLISIFLLSGCTVEYNAYITKETVLENTLVNGLTNESFPITAYIDDQGASETNEKIEGIAYYDINQNVNFTEYKYTFPFERYQEGTGVNYCYKKVNVYKINENSYSLRTNNFNSCIDYYDNLTQINVNLKFSDDFTISSNNADNVNNNTYSWIINKDNYDKKTIEIVYSLKEKDKVVMPSEKNNSNLIIILGSFIVLGIILAIIIKMRKKEQV